MNSKYAMIEKPTIIITSLGRTGTKFFAKVFDIAVPDGTSLHQPDIISRKKPIIEQFRDSGFANIILYRTLGKWSLITLSDKYIKGEIDSTKAKKELLRQRKEFITSKEGSVYIESSSGYYGLIDTVNHVFKNYKIVYLIRDGRDWVRSQYNWGGLYSKHFFLGTLKRIFGHQWLTAEDFDNDPYNSSWKHMTRFEKICWAWAKLNNHALERIKLDPQAKLYKFEDIFRSIKGRDNLFELVDYATQFPGIDNINWDELEDILKKPENQSVGRFPEWPEWTKHQKQYFQDVCGPLMEEIGYRQP